MDKSKIIDIISEIIDGIVDNQSLEEVEKRLIEKKKYDKSMVATAYSWIYDKVIANSLNDIHMKKEPTGLRVFSDDEKRLLGVENSNRLLKLINFGFLTNADIDNILDQIHLFQSEPEVSQEEINILLLSSLFEVDKFVEPGSRTLLFLSDTIN